MASEPLRRAHFARIPKMLRTDFTTNMHFYNLRWHYKDHNSNKINLVYKTITTTITKTTTKSIPLKHTVIQRRLYKCKYILVHMFSTY